MQTFVLRARLAGKRKIVWGVGAALLFSGVWGVGGPAAQGLEWRALLAWYTQEVEVRIALSEEVQPVLRAGDFAAALRLYVTALPRARANEEKIWQAWERSGGKASRFRRWQIARRDTDHLATMAIACEYRRAGRIAREEEEPVAAAERLRQEGSLTLPDEAATLAARGE